MSERGLDRTRFAKCRAMMERGATAGERAAGEAAAARLASAAGLSLAEALDLADGAPDRRTRARGPDPAPRRPYPWEKAPLRADPITVEEILAQKAANLARLKRKAAREAARQREILARQEAETAALREEQAARDRAWAEAKAGRT